MQDKRKLVIVTRKDLTPGQRAVQSTHAVVNFIFEHPSRAGPWFKESNYLVQLEVDDERALHKLIGKLDYHQICYTVFREPDMDNRITAVAIEPSPLTQKVVAKIPLLFKYEQTNLSIPENNGDQMPRVQQSTKSLV